MGQNLNKVYGGAVGGNPRANQRHMFLRIDWDRDRMAELFRAFWGYVHAEEGGLRTFFGEVLVAW